MPFKLIHELKHAYQFEIGASSFTTDGFKHGDINDELEAFARQASFMHNNGYQDANFQNIKDKGPIPEGLWNVDHSNTQHFEDLSWWNQCKSYIGCGEWPGAKGSWGVHRTWIDPIGDTNIYGRSGFSIHGGKDPGSAGCIDLTKHNDSFHNWLKNNKHIILRVQYD